MSDRRCTICHRLISKKRFKRFPRAVTCSGGVCQDEHARRLHNLASMHYQRRLRAAAKKVPAQRAPQTNGHAPVDTSPPRTWSDAVEALCGPVTSGEGLAGRE